MTPPPPRDPARRPFHSLRCVIGPFAAPLYGAVVAARNRRFDRGDGVRRLPVPVVSVGNLTVGGTGKTPFVTWLCHQLLSRGRIPAIALRGYKSAGGRSDEAEEYRSEFSGRGVAVIVNPDRFAAVSGVLAGGQKPDVVILDDGFQHRQLHRDLDIVLIDAKSNTPTDRLLPWGDLREPFGNAARADVLVYTHAEGEAPPPPIRDGQLVATSTHRWDRLRTMRAGGLDAADQPVEWLKGRRVVVVCGIGRPQRFIEACERSGCEVAGSLILGDHHALEPHQAVRVARDAAKAQTDVIVTTMKDLFRFGGVPEPWKGFTVVAPLVSLRVTPADAVVQRVLAAIGGAFPTA